MRLPYAALKLLTKTFGVLQKISYFCKNKTNDEMSEEVKNRVTYMVYCVSAFAKRFNLTVKQAYGYLHRFKGIAFLDECYEAEHQLSIRNAVDDLIAVCGKNGGALK